MKFYLSLIGLVSCGIAFGQNVKNASALSPDGHLRVDVEVNGTATYSVKYDDDTVLSTSQLGLVGNFTDLSKELSLTGIDVDTVRDSYDMNRTKASHNDYLATRLVCHLKNNKEQPLDIEWLIDNNNIAMRYFLPKKGETGSIRVLEEKTSFNMPDGTTTFLTPQSHAMIGWKRTKPSYEEDYVYDAPMTQRSHYGHGWTFPCLFKEPDQTWVLISETGVDSHYCGSRLSDYDPAIGYQIAYPMAEENNGIGTIEPAFALPGATAWRTITVGHHSLAPIVETTIQQDVVTPRYSTENDYQFGKGTWSWIVWQDGSINYEDQVKYIDLASAMGFNYTLVDNWWDTNIGRARIEELSKYAKSKNVELFMWYSSSGYWNDIVQGPTSYMDNSIIRKKEMKWLKSIGVKGIKVDFFGGDKQETMRLYEEILSDADDNGLMVIFHGCTIPRGWERMYPNYVGSEAVLASENIYFNQRNCDIEAMCICTHPFIRNAQGCMEFGGCFMNRRLNRKEGRGNFRRTTDVAELATCVLFQNPIQNFALTPDNLEGAPAICMDFLRIVPTTWDETRYIDGYPGKTIAIARRKGDKWYIAAVNAMEQPWKLTIDQNNLKGVDLAKLTLIQGGNEPVEVAPKLKKGKVTFTINNNDAIVLYNK